MIRQLIQGWNAPPMAEQFPELPVAVTHRLEAINMAITELRIADLLTDAQVNAIRGKKFPALVGRELAKVKPTSHGAGVSE